MTPDQFRAALAELGLSQAQLRRDIEAATGERLHHTTPSRYATGERAIPATLAAYLDLRLELRRRGLADPHSGTSAAPASDAA